LYQHLNLSCTTFAQKWGWQLAKRLKVKVEPYDKCIIWHPKNRQQKSLRNKSQALDLALYG
jgi:hypothetical protein